MESSDRDAAFGPWLRRRRRMLDLTQKAFASRVGCSVAAIRKLERDERRPSRRMAAALAAVLDVPEDEHAAFILFARAGWADHPPNGPRLQAGTPWVAQRTVVPSGPDALHPLQTLAPPRPAPAGGPHPPHDGPRALAREPELHELERELERALAGDGRAVLIAGEAGQGKTALMTAFAARAQAAHPDLLVALGTCNAYTGRGDPFLPFRQILAQLTGEVPAGPHLDPFDRERSARLTRTMPLATRALLEHGPHLFDSLLPARPLRARLQNVGIAVPPLATSAAPPRPPPASPGSPEHDRLALRAETATSLTALADHAPLLLLVDDLQWLDDSSAELLLHLARAAAGHRLLLVGAFRPAGLPASQPGQRQAPHPLHELARTCATSIDLDRADGRAFVDGWLDSEANDLDDAFRAALTRQTAGHPLFTIELLRAMQERGDLARDAGGRWVTAATLRWDQLPTRIADALAARIGRLDAGCRDILRVASVEGETFTAEVVARVLELEPRRVVRILGTELDHTHRLVAPVDATRSSTGLISRYRFRHNLIQRFVFDAIDPNERAYLHQEIAAALEQLLDEDADPVALALHYTLAHAPERAALHHRKAGDRARKTHALDQATEHYRAALDHWPDPEPLTRASLQYDLGECQWLRLELDDARRNLTEACAALESAGEVRSAGAAEVILAMIAAVQNDFASAFDAARTAVAMLEPAGESAELAAALSHTGYLHLLVSQFAEGAAWGERAMALAERVDARSVMPRALFSVGSALPFLDPPRFEEGIALLERSFRLADELNMAFEGCVAAMNLAVVLETMGRYQEAGTRFRAALAYAERHQLALYEQEGVFSVWWHAWTHGDWSEAFARLPYLRRLVEDTTSGPHTPFAVWLASSELDLGRSAQARATLGGQAYLRDLERPAERLPYLAARLRAAAWTGDARGADRAAGAIVEAVRPTPPALEYDAIVAVLEALRHLARGSAANGGAGVTACLNALQDLERRYGSAEAQAALQEGRALRAMQDGPSTRVAELWVQAADHWQAGTFPLREARARAAAARALDREAGRNVGEAQRERAQLLLSTLAEQIPSVELRDSFARVTRAILAPGDRPPH
ncbi:MAG TPA: AAA family ATPase [Trueperaceae bacterium]|nr:AAA family ATPase [Trueperaceae bacterium]